MRRPPFFLKTLSFFLAVILALSIAPAPAHAKDGDTFEVDGIYYAIISEKEGTVRVLWADAKAPYSGSITIPGLVTPIDGKKAYWVVEIANRAFENCDITDVTISESVTSIGDYAFRRTPITSVTLPSSIVSIGKSAFAQCTSLNTITFITGEQGSSLNVIGGSAFAGCTSLVSVELPFGLFYISEMAFMDCSSLKDITIPDSVMEIDMDAFAQCSSLTEISLPEYFCPYYPLFGGCDALELINLPDFGAFGDTSPFVQSLSYCNNLRALNVSDENSNYETVDGVLYSIDKYTKVVQTLIKYPNNRPGPFTIPEYVKVIAESAFDGCRTLTSLTIPEGVAYIGPYAFTNWDSLESMIFFAKEPPNTHPNIFAGTTDHEFVVYVPEGTVEAYYSAFGWPRIQIEEIGSNKYEFEANSIWYQVKSEMERTVCVTGISDDYNYEAVSGIVAIPQTVSYSGSDYQVTEVGDYCFVGNDNIVEVFLPESIKAIGEGAFSGCDALLRLKIPNAVTELRKGTIISCENLREIVLPSSLSIIDTSELFDDCPSLASISIANNPKFYSIDGVLYGHINLYQDYGFDDVDEKGNLIYDREMVMLVRYPVAKPGPFEIPEGVEVIGQFAFYCTSMTMQLTVPASIKFVNKSAFSTWETLNSVTFLGETPPVFTRSVLMGAAKKGLTVYVPTEECIAAYKAALNESKPGGVVTYEPIPANKGSGGNSGGENSPGGSSGGGNDPGDNTGGGSGGNTGVGSGSNSGGGTGDGSGGGSGGSSGGGSGGGDGSGNNNPSGNTGANGPAIGGNGTDYGSTRTTSDYRSLQELLTNAIQAANAANSGEASLRLLNYKSLDLDTLKQLAAAAKASGKSCVLYADTIEGNAVQVRVMFNPANAVKALQLAGSVNSTGAWNIDSLFEKNFQNKVAVVELAQQGDFGMTVSIAARVNLTGLNTKTLYFYIYDKTKNIYNRIKNPKSRIDKNGYLWFDTMQGGYIIITDKPLQSKRS